jgi:hypothetical protein
MMSIWRVLVRRFSRRRETARPYHAKSGEKNKEKNDMRYLLLIYSNEAEDARLTPEQRQAQNTGYYAYSQALQDSGAMLGGEPLHPTSSATTVRVRNGKMLTTDGPFAETKEQLGGFYMVNCDNLDQAIEWAAKIPHAASGSIEVRPIMEMG